MDYPYYVVVDSKTRKDVIKVISKDRAIRIAKQKHDKDSKSYHVYYMGNKFYSRLICRVPEWGTSNGQ